MQNLKANRVVALKQVGISKKEVEEYRKSSREYFVQYRGKNSTILTQNILGKVALLADIRRKMGIEVAGVLFEDNLEVTFVFYVNNDPKDAWYEKNVFLNSDDFETELDRQISSNFIPDTVTNGNHVIYKKGFEADFIPLN